MDKESAELTMTDIVLGIDDIDDNSNDDGEDDDAVAAQHWLSRDRRHFRSQDRYHHSWLPEQGQSRPENLVKFIAIS